MPIHRIPRAAVDKTLETYAGITTSDLKNTNSILYLSDYDSYYNFTSDYGPGSFQTAEGARDGGTVRLRSEPMWGDGGEADGGSGGDSRRRETRRGSGPGFLEKIRRGRRGRFHPSAPGRGRDGPPWRRRS